MFFYCQVGDGPCVSLRLCVSSCTDSDVAVPTGRLSPQVQPVWLSEQPTCWEDQKLPVWTHVLTAARVWLPVSFSRGTFVHISMAKASGFFEVQEIEPVLEHLSWLQTCRRTRTGHAALKAEADWFLGGLFLFWGGSDTGCADRKCRASWWGHAPQRSSWQL